MDLGIVKSFTQTVGNDEIVNTPSGILLPGLETV
jgi:hypothetical protein